MNKQERIKAGFVGTRKFIDPNTGEELLINFEDENVVVFSGRERKLIEQRSKRVAEKNFTGFTEEEEKLYSEIHYEK